jgi:hypothetical protein
MRKAFIVEVPCTIVDRYFIFADSEEEVREKIASGNMKEESKAAPGDYIIDSTTDAEPETHWDRAVIKGEK